MLAEVGVRIPDNLTQAVELVCSYRALPVARASFAAEPTWKLA